MLKLKQQKIRKEQKRRLIVSAHTVVISSNFAFQAYQNDKISSASLSGLNCFSSRLHAPSSQGGEPMFIDFPI